MSAWRRGDNPSLSPEEQLTLAEQEGTLGATGPDHPDLREVGRLVSQSRTGRVFRTSVSVLHGPMPRAAEFGEHIVHVRSEAIDTPLHFIVHNLTPAEARTYALHLQRAADVAERLIGQRGTDAPGASGAAS